MKRGEINSKRSTAIILSSLSTFIKSELKRIYILFNVLLIFIVITATSSAAVMRALMLILRMIYVSSLMI